MRYAGTRASETNPLRSIPLLRPAWVLHRAPMPTFAPMPAPVFEQGRGEFFVPTAAALLTRELANAEAALREAVRVYDAARAGIGQANRTSTAAVVAGGRVVMPSLPFTAQRIRERKSAAFQLFNQRRSLLVGARRRVDAARAALGLPSLAAVQERQAVADVTRAGKRRPYPIASAAARAA